MFTLISAPVAHATGDDTKASDQFLENADAKKKGSMADTLVVMSASALGAGAITGCIGPGKVSPSNVAFAAGSIIYLLSEISSGKEQKESIKKRAEDLALSKEKMTGGGDAQKMALEEALKDQEETLKFIKKRKGFMTAVNVAWVAASGLAIAEAMNILLLPVFTQACAGLNITSIPWLIAIEIAFAATIGISEGQPLQALLAPIALGMAVFFIPLKALPATRAVLYSASAVFALKAAGELSEKEKVIEKNVSMLKEALGQFEKETQTTTGLDVASNSNNDSRANSTNTTSGSLPGSAAGQGSINTLASGNQAAAAGTTASTTKTCAVGVGDKVAIGADCSRPVTLAFTRPSVEIPSLTTAGVTATQAANSFAAGDSAGAEISAASLSAMAANVEAGRKTALNLLNNRLAKEGKPKLDLDAETQKAVDSMSANISQSIDKGGAPLMAALGGLGSSPAAMAPVKVETAPVVVEPTALATAVAPVPATQLTETGMAKDLTVAQASEKKDSLDNYDVETSDISRNKEATIWQQVTNRYQTNYGRFFERKKVPTTP